MPVLGEVTTNALSTDADITAPLKTVGTRKGVARITRKSSAGVQAASKENEQEVVGQKRRAFKEDDSAAVKKPKVASSDRAGKCSARQQFECMTRVSSNAPRAPSARSLASENDAKIANSVISELVKGVNMSIVMSDDETVTQKQPVALKKACDASDDAERPARPSSSLSSLSGDSVPSLVSSSSSSPADECAPCAPAAPASSAPSIPATHPQVLQVPFTQESPAACSGVRDQTYESKVTFGQLDNVDDVLAYLWENEHRWGVDSSYMSQQPAIDIGMRAVLVDWIIDVHTEFQLSNETLYLTVALIDKFLSKHRIDKSNLQLVGVTCMWLASKYEEIDPHRVTEFSDICDNAYNWKMIVETEKLLLKALNWELSFPSPYDFLRCWSVSRVSPNKAAFEAAKFLTEVALQDYSFLKYTPSVLAAAALHVAVDRCSDSETTRLSTAFLLDMHAPGTVENCARHLRKATASLLARSDLSAIRNKYLQPSHMEVVRNFL
eukprot:tig00021312_g20047.t1